MSHSTWWKTAVQASTIFASGSSHLYLLLCLQIWLVIVARLPSLQASYQQQLQVSFLDITSDMRMQDVHRISLLLFQGHQFFQNVLRACVLAPQCCPSWCSVVLDDHHHLKDPWLHRHYKTSTAAATDGVVALARSRQPDVKLMVTRGTMQVKSCLSALSS